ncbi:pentapeptide repeat protein [Candidatus Vecturithrix granuli]|uniref:Pentapeptide repeat protein n=1 Tax=Vecturithrix granuli TaxID=1499967 RepID=A0A081BUR3_VECG1|nr:pentapeptide repeat protein [Candidatus Vecturithrix granuli]
MANKKHLELMKQGGKIWNRWRETTDEKKPDLSGANLRGADLRNVDLSWVNLMEANLQETKLAWANLRRANLRKADLRRAILREANLSWSNLSWANLREAYLRQANLRKADLSWANLKEANLREADLREADLHEADLRSANLQETDLKEANLREAYLSDAVFRSADLGGADLRDADLRGAQLFKSDLSAANLSGCHVYGLFSWENILNDTTNQQDLILTDWDEPIVSIDELDVAQFMYLLLHNPKIPHIFQTLPSQLVILLGRFGQERKPVLDELRDALRQHDYMPVLLDFHRPENQDFTHLVTTITRFARFIIVDFTQPKTILKPAAYIVRTTLLPFQPILTQHDQQEPPILQTLRHHYKTVLDTVCFTSPQDIARSFQSQIMIPMDIKFKELEERYALSFKNFQLSRW